MILDRVTITGADDKTPIKGLLELTAAYPFVEWGVLVSKTSEGGPRFPSRDWITEFVGATPTDTRLSLHVCGRWVRSLLMGEWPQDLDAFPLDEFQRVQLNTHGHAHAFAANASAAMLGAHVGHAQIIVQMDEVNGANVLSGLRRYNIERRGIGDNAVPLFDTSGGAGIVPKAWPKPGPLGVDYYGYAGGLGPDTLAAELPRIEAAVGIPGMRYWIDMERRVRTDDEVLDLAKVEAVLKACAPIVRTQS